MSAMVQVVVYEGSGSRPLAAESRGEMFRTLLEKGYAVASVRQGGVANLSAAATTVVLGRFENQPPLDRELQFRDIEGLPAVEVTRVVDEVREAASIPAPGK